MIYSISKSCVGYAHIANGMPCQDATLSYRDSTCMIMACCDGHGGARYIRSDRGSRFACQAVLEVLKEASSLPFPQREMDGFFNQIKMNVLCAYNRLVEEDLSLRPLRKKEMEALAEDEVLDLLDNPARAYGTTLAGALLCKKKIILISIGDTEALLFRRGEIIHPFPDDGEPAANLTYSMCQENAFQHLRVGMFNADKIDGVLLCTDGLSAPYQSYANFASSFLRPSVYKILTTGSLSHLDTFIDEIASSRGVGDDVSLAMWLFESASPRRYRERKKP